jgi:hypothetical protein
MKNYFPSIRPERADYLVNFSTRHKFLYVETPKVACSTIKRMLQKLEGETPENVHDRDASPLLTPRRDPGGFEWAQTRHDYVRFSFVRNPFSRALSCYLDKFVENIYERDRLLPDLGFQPGTSITFLQFLQAVNSQTYFDMDIHWLPQSVILEGLNRPSFIGRFENLLADLRKVFEVIAPGHVEIEKFNRHATNASDKVEALSKEERDLVIQIYRQDFVIFSYSTDPRFA